MHFVYNVIQIQVSRLSQRDKLQMFLTNNPPFPVAICIKIDEFCIIYDEFSIKFDEFCI